MALGMFYAHSRKVFLFFSNMDRENMVHIGRHAEVLVLIVFTGMLYASSLQVLLFFSNMHREICVGPTFLVTIGMFTLYVYSRQVLLFFSSMDQDT